MASAIVKGTENTLGASSNSKPVVITKGAYGVVIRDPKQPGKLIKQNFKHRIVNGITSAREVGILCALSGNPYVVQIVDVRIGDDFVSGASDIPVHFSADRISYVMIEEECDLITKLYNTTWRTKENIMSAFVDILLGTWSHHQIGFVHLDLKPNNILMTGNRARVCDPGIATPESRCSGKAFNMTSWYRAPEAMLSEHGHDYSSQADVWSLGCILFELICKSSLFSVFGTIENNNALFNFLTKTIPFDKDSLRQMTNGSYLNAPVWTWDSFFDYYSSKPECLGFSREVRDLLSQMLEINPRRRITLKQILEHPALEAHRARIRDFLTPEKNPWYNNVLGYKKFTMMATSKPYVVNCIERIWAMEIATKIYENNKHGSKDPWYLYEILIYAINLFDTVLQRLMPPGIPEQERLTAIETNGVLRGKLSSKEGTQMRFVFCVYMMIKYYAVTYSAPMLQSTGLLELFPHNQYQGVDNFFLHFEEFVFQKLNYKIFRHGIADYILPIVNTPEIREHIFRVMVELPKYTNKTYENIFRIIQSKTQLVITTPELESINVIGSMVVETGEGTPTSSRFDSRASSITSCSPTPTPI